MSAPGNVRTRRIGMHEADLLRRLRLAGLKQDPSAFGSTYARESKFDDDVWQQRADDGAAGVERVTFIAEVDDEPGGIAVGERSAENSDDVFLFAMWVAPSARRKGAALALIEAVARWAVSIGRSRILLAVTDGNPAAVAAYRRAGFVEVDDRIPGLDHLRCPTTMARAAAVSGATG